MPKIQPTQTISFNDRLYPVADFPEDIQQTIATMDDWRQTDVDVSSNLMMIRTALQSIQQTLTNQIQQWEANQVAANDQTAENNQPNDRPVKKQAAKKTTASTTSK